jgi:hypothetical protein
MYGSSHMFRHYIAILRERSKCLLRDAQLKSSRQNIVDEHVVSKKRFFLACVILKMKPLRYVETSGNIYPTTRRNNPTDLHLPSLERNFMVVRFKTLTTNARMCHYGSCMLFRAVASNGNEMTVNAKQIAISVMHSIRSTAVFITMPRHT